MMDIIEQRALILKRLDASRGFLKYSTPIGIAKELMVQAIDIAGPELRRAVFEVAIAEIDDAPLDLLR